MSPFHHGSRQRCCLVLFLCVQVSAAPKSANRSAAESSYSKPVSRLRQLLPRIHSHGSKSDSDQHTKKGSPQRADGKRSSSVNSNTGCSSSAGQQAGHSSQHKLPQQQHHQQQLLQQQNPHRWHRHQQQQATPVPAQPGPLAGSSAQAAAGKSYSGSSSKQRSDRGYIAVTATAHNANHHQHQNHHHQHHHSPQQQQPQQQLFLQAQQPALAQQQPYGFPAPHAGPVTVPVVADSPSSLLLPPPAATGSQQGQHQQLQQPMQAVPSDLDQDKCRRLAEVLLKCGKPADASAWAQAALSTDPWNVDLLLLRGRALEAAGNIPGVQGSVLS